MGAEEEESIKKNEEEKAKRRIVLEEVVKTWNGIIKNLTQTLVLWERYGKLCTENAISVEEFPIEAQKVLYKANPWGDFDLIIEDIITQPRLAEHLKTEFISLN